MGVGRVFFFMSVRSFARLRYNFTACLFMVSTDILISEKGKQWVELCGCKHVLAVTYTNTAIVIMSYHTRENMLYSVVNFDRITAFEVL